MIRVSISKIDQPFIVLIVLCTNPFEKQAALLAVIKEIT
jgi:hypothetical protein